MQLAAHMALMRFQLRRWCVPVFCAVVAAAVASAGFGAAVHLPASAQAQRHRDDEAWPGYHAVDVLAPNMSSCLQPHDVPPEELPLNCCAPGPSSSAPPRLFRPPPIASPAQILVRRSAHAVDQAYSRRLARAYALMKALPADDPRSFTHQANIHCAYCNSVYTQINSQHLFQAHGSWLFFPFHRWYLYFHERILQKLLADADGDEEPLPLTFWNYDHPQGSTFPPLFANHSDLYNPFRNPRHDPPAIINIIDSPCVFYEGSPRQKTQLLENAHAMYRALVRDASASRHRFFGAPLRQGEDPQTNGWGTVEKVPHNGLHSWTGDPAQVGSKDMGTFHAAARDPVFYSHHAELDRFWDLWKALDPANNRDFADPDFLEAEFAFYNEDAELVRVKVGDCLNSSALGSVYEDVEIPWIQSVPTRFSDGVAALPVDATVCQLDNPILAPCSIVVPRDALQATLSEEYVTLSSMDWQAGHHAYVDIFINLPDANASTSTGCLEFVDFVNVLPPFVVGTHTFTRQFTIADRIRDLNLTLETSVVITIVPHGLPSVDFMCVPFSIANISIDYYAPYLSEDTRRGSAQQTQLL